MRNLLISVLSGSLLLLNPWGLLPAGAYRIPPRSDAGAVMMSSIRESEARQREPWRYRTFTRKDLHPPIPVEDLIRWENRRVEASIEIDSVEVEDVNIEDVDTESKDVEAVDVEDVDIEDVDTESKDIEEVQVEDVQIEDVDVESVNIE